MSTLENKITIVIPFVNEGNELNNTLESIRSFSPYIEIILINDYSDDGFDYADIAKRHNVSIIENENRFGVALSREIGISHVKTTYFLLLDAHMRIFTESWEEILLSYLESNENAIFCCTCVSINARSEISHKLYGAKIDFFGNGFREILEPSWLTHNEEAILNPIVEIPCILGASYACRKEYWDYLGGIRGLRTWGSDEVFISLKNWLAGGKSFLIPEIEIGHIFRKGISPPYNIYLSDVYFNKMLVAKICMSNELENILFDKLNSTHELIFNDALNLINMYDEIINELKLKFSIIKKNSIEDFILFNNSFISKKEFDSENVLSSTK